MPEFDSTTLKTSLLVNKQVPEFVRDEHPLFISFLEAYYEFLETEQGTQNNDLTKISKDLKRIQDIGDYTNATDVPFRFVPCMISGLSYYLAQKYQPQLIQAMKLAYEDELARALAEDGSASSTYITPKAYYPGA